MDVLGLSVPRQLRIQHLVGPGTQLRRDRNAAEEVSATLPAAIEQNSLVDQRCTFAHRLARLRSGLHELFSGMQTLVARKVDVAVLADGQLDERSAVMFLTTPPDQIGVWVVGRPGACPARRER